MSLEISFILIMLFITIYVAIINIFSILFRMTGLTKEKSKFQTITLFTAVGFTTSESEIITSDKTRRKIATACMIVGNVFSVIIVSLIVNLISNFSMNESKEVFIVIGSAFIAFVVVLLFFQIPPIKRGMGKMIEVIALKSFGKDKSENFLTLLDNYGDNAIVEVYINRLPQMLNGISIAMSGIKQVYGINILMIKRKEHVISVTPDTMIQQNDCIVVFGKRAQINEVFSYKYAKYTDTEPTTDNSIDLLDNFSSEAMTKVVLRTVPEVLKGRSLAECRLKALYGINIVIIKRNQRLIEVNARVKLVPNDELIVFGPFNNIRYLFGEENKPDASAVSPEIGEASIYEECPSFENELLAVKPISADDCDGLLKVYSDEKAWPFFNIDDSNNDDLRFTTKQRMVQAIEFWEYAYKSKWAVRWTIWDKKQNQAVGTVEVTQHQAKDFFHNGAIVRLDLRSDWETKQTVCGVLKLIENACLEGLGCDKIATKSFDSEERIAALKELGFEESLQPLAGHYGSYHGYWIKKQKTE